ncbi:hypothetical protein GCM10007423_50080 [Dyadobacter endophyticus]|uniref:Pyrrolo-quinoline quinone repeat domain-containing protein n=1 Tax=Dyadobacter endophyticus TaxID=1749036 RepID=A0ABQ1Z3E7_9BACT|nr:PQQ-binding-like beta-propeller repeat protein [Dyadobacter endophyticus]GGH48690.1 hypothetical protein GCM10007423_50080 [Dyadobacter endophyticus]
MNKRVLLFLFFLAWPTPTRAQLRWQLSTGGGIHGAPAVTGSAVYFGSDDKNLYAVDKKTGKQIWKFATAGPIRSTPAVTGNKIIVNSADGSVYALDKQKGKLQWAFKTGGELTYDLWDYYLSSPVVNEGIVYLGSGDSSVYAIDSESGKMVWRFQTGGVVHASPVVQNGRVFIGSYDGHFYTLDARTGKVVWKFKTIGDPSFPKGEIQRAAYVDQERVIFGSRDFFIYTLDAESGEVIWKMKEKGSWVIATPLSDRKSIFVGTSDTHQFYSLDVKTGQVNWVLPLNMRVYATALFVGNSLVFGCFNGKIYFVDPGTGKVNSTFQTEQSKRNYSQVYDATDHIRKDFDMYGDNYINAEKQILSLGSILSGPTLDNGTLYFGDAAGHLYALKADPAAID